MWARPTTTATTEAQGYWVRWNATTSAATTFTFYNNVFLPSQYWATAAPSWRPRAPAIIRARQSPEEIAAAAARARTLLIAELDPRQRRQFEREDCFVVRGRRGIYRIRKGIAANIDVLDGQLITHRLCAHPSDTEMPREDVMLAQLIHLRHDEDGLLKIANRHAAPGINPATDRHLAWAEERLAA